MRTKKWYYPNTKIIKFRDVYVDNKIRRHYFYSLLPKYHKYLEVHYDCKGKITKYIKHKYPRGYYEYLVLMSNGYLKDKMYEESPYCKYIERETKNNFYLTVHRYNLIDGKMMHRSSEYIKNGLIMKMVHYNSFGERIIKTYPDGKKIKVYRKPSDKPSKKFVKKYY